MGWWPAVRVWRTGVLAEVAPLAEWVLGIAVEGMHRAGVLTLVEQGGVEGMWRGIDEALRVQDRQGVIVFLVGELERWCRARWRRDAGCSQ